RNNRHWRVNSNPPVILHLIASERAQTSGALQVAGLQQRRVHRLLDSLMAQRPPVEHSMRGDHIRPLAGTGTLCCNGAMSLPDTVDVYSAGLSNNLLQLAAQPGVHHPTHAIV